MTDTGILQFIMRTFEGEASDDPTDRGNAGGRRTIWGITWALFHDRHPDIPYDAFLRLSHQQALEFYRAWLFEGYRLHTIADWRLKLAVVDFAVNSGPRTAIVALQRLVGVTADGVFGPVTEHAVAQFNAVQLCQKLIAARCRHYANTPEIRAVKRGGWFNRIATLLEVTVP